MEHARMDATNDSITRVTHKLFDVVEAHLAILERVPALDEPGNPFVVPARRWISDMMALWRLCARPAYRRSRKCRCEPVDCIARYTQRVPQDVRDGVKTMLIGRSERLSFDAMRERAPKPIAAVEAWLGCPDDAARKHS
jgi:hypothetical protein